MGIWLILLKDLGVNEFEDVQNVLVLAVDFEVVRLQLFVREAFLDDAREQDYAVVLLGLDLRLELPSHEARQVVLQVEHRLEAEVREVEAAAVRKEEAEFD